MGVEQADWDGLGRVVSGVWLRSARRPSSTGVGGFSASGVGMILALVLARKV